MPSGDINGDGFHDFLATFYGSYVIKTAYLVSGFPINGDVELSDSNTPLLASQEIFPIGDFNGDGIPDFCAHNYEETGNELKIQFGRRENFASSAKYRSYAKGGKAPLRAVGEVPGGAIYPPDARAWVGFGDGDGPSLQSVTLHRNLDEVSNLPANMKPAFVRWTLETNRQNYTFSNLALKYVDREISGLNEDNLRLVISYTGAAGPWIDVGNATFEADRDTIHFQTGYLPSGVADFVIVENTPPNATSNTFNQSAENWTFTAPRRPDLATGDQDTATGALQIAITPGEDSFGMYESPLASIANESQPVLYRATYRAYTDLPDRLQNPIVRFRTSLANFEQTQELVAPSVDNVHGRDAFGPSLQGNDYEQFFLAPAHSDSLRMDFDVIAPDPADASPAVISLDSARLEPVTIDEQTTTVMYYDFRNSQTNGFALAAPHPTMTPASFTGAATAEGLLLIADASQTTHILAFQFFGKTEGALRFEGDHLYRADFMIASHVSAANAHSLPGFRLRVNSESFQFATLLHVEPQNAQQPLPIAGAPVTYSLYFKAPAAINGEAAIFSFDYLTTPEAEADSAQPIILQQLSVSEY
ncbi:hypothetical protein BH09SUM1_BH09SUM1_34200 [soil metagenome]